jgi:purine-binding chemotaxis protein CheW
VTERLDQQMAQVARDVALLRFRVLQSSHTTDQLVAGLRDLERLAGEMPQPGADKERASPNRSGERSATAEARSDDLEALRQTAHLLLFEVGGIECAVPINRVREVASVHRAAGAPTDEQPLIRSIVLRGDVLPLMDLSGGVGESEPQRRATYPAAILQSRTGGRLALRVDRAIGPATIDPENLEPLTAGSRGVDLVRGVVELDARKVLVLDVDAILGSAGL